MAQVESDGNPLAVRFEQAHKPMARFIAGMGRVAGCSLSTAQILCRMSWGKFQIMGDNLVDLGLTVSPLQFCMSEALQESLFDKFLSKHGINFSLESVLNDAGNLHDFASIYNGPDNIDAYSKRMLSVYAERK
jgi:hypothetical protein